MQRTGDAIGAHIILRDTTTSTGPARGRRRRAQESQPCDGRSLAARVAAVGEACCSSTGGGHRRTQADCDLPATCPSEACAETFVQFYEDCRAEMGDQMDQYESLNDSCVGMLPDGGESLAMMLGVECTEDGVSQGDCIPECNEHRHGFILLLNIDGDDLKFTCELHHTLYSWVGGATDGGYLGEDFEMFFSAVNTGAPGRYVGTLTQSAGISTDLTITPGQHVTIEGDALLAYAPHWGTDNSCPSARDGQCRDGGPNQQERYGPSCDLGTDSADCNPTLEGGGGIVVQARGSLSMRYVELDDSMITLEPGGSLSLSSMVVPAAVLSAVSRRFSGAGSTLQLADVTVPEYRSDDSCPRPSPGQRGHWGARDGHCQDGGANTQTGYGVHCVLGTDATDCGMPLDLGPQTLAITVRHNGSRVSEGSLKLGSPVFAVGSGRSCTNVHSTVHSLGNTAVAQVWSECLEWDDTPPCETSQGGRCVGRAQGYGDYEDCEITVSGGFGQLAACSVFDTVNDLVSLSKDSLTMPDGSMQCGSDCPAGRLLGPGDVLSWHSNLTGFVPQLGHNLRSYRYIGEELLGSGGWEICFPGPGCTNRDAVNFFSAATEDDGSCILCDGGRTVPVVFNGERACPVPGCTRPAAPNFDPAANFNDGSCVLPTIQTDGIFIGGELITPGERLIWQFSARQGQHYELETEMCAEADCLGDTRATQWRHNGDTVMQLLDTDGTTVLSENDDDSHASRHLDSYIEWTCPASGVYKVLVRAYSTTETGRFQVRVTES